MKEYIVPVCDDEKDYGDELIRCKDCKYGERWAPDKCYCNGFLNAWVDEDDFCAWAEPKETNNDH